MLPFTRAWFAVLAATLAVIAHPAGAADKTINVAQASDVLTLDPMLDTSPISINVYRNVFDALTRIGPDGKVEPLLATSWQASDGGKTWEFSIRPNVKFHDGTTLTVQDIVWNFKRLATEEKSIVRTYISKVKDVEAVGNDKVRFTLIEAFAPFDRQMSLISIIPRKAFEELGPQRFSLSPVGSGPFKVVRWVKDDRLELEAFADYWGGAPKVKTVIFRPVPSESARASALVSGELDIVPILPPAMVDSLSQRQNVKVVKVPSNKVVYLGFDTNNPLLSNLKVRQAIDLAIDRKALTSRLLRGLGVPAGEVLAPVTFGYSDDIKPTEYNVARAKQLVSESGYKGEKIVLQYPTNNLAFGREVAQAIANYLGAVGINVELQGMEYAAFFPLWGQRKLNGIHLFAFGPSIMDADLVLSSLYDKNGRVYWIDPQVQDLLVQQRAETDSDKRRALICQIMRLSADNLPYAPLYNEVHAYGVSSGVTWTPRPDERLFLQQADTTN